MRRLREGIPPRTISLRRVKIDRKVRQLPVVERPRTRADCEDGPRPCPFVACRHNLAVEVTSVGNLLIQFPATTDPDDDEIDFERMPETCALDVAKDGGATLEVAGKNLNLTRERVRQIEMIAMKRVRNGTSKAARKLQNMKGA